MINIKKSPIYSTLDRKPSPNKGLSQNPAAINLSGNNNNKGKYEYKSSHINNGVNTNDVNSKLNPRANINMINRPSSSREPVSSNLLNGKPIDNIMRNNNPSNNNNYSPNIARNYVNSDQKVLINPIKVIENKRILSANHMNSNNVNKQNNFLKPTTKPLVAVNDYKVLSGNGPKLLNLYRK